MPVYIRRNIKLAEAPSYGKTIFEYESGCHGSQDYTKVAQYLHNGRVESSQVEVAEQGVVGAEEIQETPQPTVIEETVGAAEPEDIGE